MESDATLLDSLKHCLAVNAKDAEYQAELDRDYPGILKRVIFGD
jgi:hypothetical protein